MNTVRISEDGFCFIDFPDPNLMIKSIRYSDHLVTANLYDPYPFAAYI